MGLLSDDPSEKKTENQLERSSWPRHYQSNLGGTGTTSQEEKALAMNHFKASFPSAAFCRDCQQLVAMVIYIGKRLVSPKTDEFWRRDRFSEEMFLENIDEDSNPSFSKWHSPMSWLNDDPRQIGQCHQSSTNFKALYGLPEKMSGYLLWLATSLILKRWVCTLHFYRTFDGRRGGKKKKFIMSV